MLINSQHLYKYPGKQYMYMHQDLYKNKLEYKYSLTLLDPRLLYIDPIQVKGHLSIRETCPELYSSLSVLCVLCLAAFNAKEHLSVLCSVGQLPTHTMQSWAASNMHYLAFCLAYIVFVLFYNHIYQKYIVLLYF